MSNLKVDLSIAEAAFNGAVDAAVLYQQHAKAAGHRHQCDSGAGRTAIGTMSWLKKIVVAAAIWSGRPTCDWMFTTVYATGAAWNETHYSNPKFQKPCCSRARSETDDGEAGRPCYAEMQQFLHDDRRVSSSLVFKPIMWRPIRRSWPINAIAPNWEADGLKIAERWWFALMPA